MAQVTQQVEGAASKLKTALDALIAGGKVIEQVIVTQKGVYIVIYH